MGPLDFSIAERTQEFARAIEHQNGVLAPVKYKYLAVPIRCEACGGEVRRIPEVGDVWLDAGIVPFSTLGWENPRWISQGYATGASKAPE